MSQHEPLTQSAAGDELPGMSGLDETSEGGLAEGLASGEVAAVEQG